jgi:non-homologous end joining protein Ku
MMYARTVLFRRMRTVLIRSHGKDLIATTLNYDYEVRSSAKAFEEMSAEFKARVFVSARTTHYFFW